MFVFETVSPDGELHLYCADGLASAEQLTDRNESSTGSTVFDVVLKTGLSISAIRSLQKLISQFK